MSLKAQHPKLEALVRSGDLTSYTLTTEAHGLAPATDTVILTFPSGAKLTITAECGAAADSDAWLTFDETRS